MDTTLEIAASPSADLFACLATVASSESDRLAVSSAGRNLSYGRLVDRARRIASTFPELQSESMVAISMPKGLALIEVIWAVLATGRPYLYLDPQDPVAYRKALLEQSECSLLLVDGESEAHQEFDSLQVLQVGSGEMPDAALRPVCESSTFGCMIQTSGSTGRPKLVPVYSRAMLQNSRQFAKSLQIQFSDRVAWLASPRVAASNSTFFGALLAGACLCPYEVKTRNFEDMLAWLNAESITILHLTPSLFRSLSRVANPDALRKVRAVKLGGERVNESDYELFRSKFSDSCQLFNGLGMSEAGGNVCHCEITGNTRVIDGIFPVGAALPGYALSLMNLDEGSVSDGSVGEIVVRSQLVTSNYVGDDASDRLSETENEARTFRTGDLGRLENGLLYVVGRSGRRVKVRGYSVDLDGVEAQLTEVAGVKEAAVVLEALGGQQRLVGYVASESSAEQIMSEVTKLLPEHIELGRISVSESLPRTASGKVDYVALSLQQPSHLAPGTTMPRNERERVLYNIWGEVLKGAEPGVYDNFFDAGGDSLAALELLARVERTFGMPVDAAWLMKRPSIAQMAAYFECRGSVLRRLLQILQPVKWEVILLKEGAGGAPWLVMPGGRASENELLVFAQLFREVSDTSPVYGLRRKGGKLSRRFPPSYQRCVVMIQKAIDKVHFEGTIRLLGECVAAPLAITLASHFEEREQPHQLLLLDPMMDASNEAYIGRKKGAYCKHPKKSDITSYSNSVTVLHTEDSFAESRLRKKWHGVLVRAGLKFFPVPGDHDSYLRDNRKALAQRLDEVVDQLSGWY